jgi:hypothetical protein
MNLVLKVILSLMFAFSAADLTLAEWPQTPAQNQLVDQCPGPTNENLPLHMYRIGIEVGLAEAHTLTGYGSINFTERLRGIKRITNASGCAGIENYIDEMIQKSAYTAPKDMQGDIVYMKEHVLGQKISDYCKCECKKALIKRLYSIWKSPYGPGTKCLTRDEAQAYRESGHGVEDLNTPCE